MRAGNNINAVCPVNWQHPLNRGLVGWWLAVPGWTGGSRWVDLCQRNHGTLTNGPTWRGALGRPGGWGCLSFDGTNDYVETGKVLFHGQTHFTFSCWMLGTASGFFAEAGPYNNSFFLEPTRFFVRGTLGNHDLSFATPLSGTQWVQVVCCRNPSKFEVYKNGVIYATHTANRGSVTLYDASPASIQIGHVSSGSGSSNTYFTGQMDSVRVQLGVCLTAAEVAALYHEERQGCPGLLNRVRPVTYFLPDAGGGALLSRLQSESLYVGSVA